ncbi:MAG: hypothetical protein ACK55I_31710, partial [bacterium]
MCSRSGLLRPLAGTLGKLVSEEIEALAKRSDDGRRDDTNQQERLERGELASAIPRDRFFRNRDPFSRPRSRVTAQVGHAIHVEHQKSALPADHFSFDPVDTGADPFTQQDATAIIDHDPDLLGHDGGRG